MTAPAPALAVEGVAVRFGAVEALSGVDLAVCEGRITGLVGPNGAGKTTLLDAITGYVRPYAGTIDLAGRPVHGMRPHRRAQAGLRRTFQSAELFDDLTVLENLAVARTRSAPPAAAIADRFDLGAAGDTLARELPAGVRRQVDLARAVAGEPRVLLLDEPGAGLHNDEVGRLARAAPFDRGRRGRGGGGRPRPSVHRRHVRRVGRPRLRFGDRVRSSGRGARHGPRRRGLPRWLSRAFAWRTSASRTPGSRPCAGLASRSAPARSWRCSVPTAPARRQRSTPSPGCRRPTAERCTWAVGTSRIARPTPAARAGLALVPDDRGLFPELSVADHLWLAAHHRPRPAELEEVHRLFPVLGERRGQRAGTLSGGEAQMLSIAVALLGRPTVLLIDELSFGLAPSIVGPLLGRCRRLADERGLGILLVEQFIDLVLDVADRALVLRSGVVALEGGAAELRAHRHRVREAYLGATLTSP